METLPVELVEHIAYQRGWEGYAALRSTSTWMRAVLPWWRVLRRARPRTLPLRSLGWNDWFSSNLPDDCEVYGMWTLDGFHGAVVFVGQGEGTCVRGLVDGTVVLNSPWRGGMANHQVFATGVPTVPSTVFQVPSQAP